MSSSHFSYRSWPCIWQFQKIGINRLIEAESKQTAETELVKSRYYNSFYLPFLFWRGKVFPARPVRWHPGPASRKITILPSCLQYCPPVHCPAALHLWYWIFYLQLQSDGETLQYIGHHWDRMSPRRPIWESSMLWILPARMEGGREGGPGLLLCSDTSDLRSNVSRGSILASSARIHTATASQV